MQDGAACGAPASGGQTSGFIIPGRATGV